MRRIPWLLVIPPLVLGSMVLLALLKLGQGEDDSLPSAFIGRPAPDFAPLALEGYQVFGPGDLRAGEVSLVNFFASWCPPCRVEHPNLMELSQSGVAVYGVNLKDRPDQAKEFLRGAGNPYRGIIADPEGHTALDWGVSAPPETFVIDGQGVIVGRLQYPITDRVMADQLAQLLAQASSQTSPQTSSGASVSSQ